MREVENELSVRVWESKIGYMIYGDNSTYAEGVGSIPILAARRLENCLCALCRQLYTVLECCCFLSMRKEEAESAFCRKFPRHDAS